MNLFKKQKDAPESQEQVQSMKETHASSPAPDAAADVKGNAGKAFRYGKSAADLDIRADNLQQGGGKYIVGMELAAVGETFCRDLHEGASLI